MTAFRRLAVAVVAVVGVMTAAPVSDLPGSTVAAADAPPLTVVGDARYVVEPDEARVRVTIGLTIRNHRAETVTRRFWFDRAYLAIQPAATGIRVSGPGAAPSVRVTRTTADHRLIEIRFGKRLYSNETLALRLSFFLRDPGGAPGRSIRIGPGLVSFPVWAVASDATPGARATVVVPTGFEIQYGAQSFATRRTLDDGATQLATDSLSDATRLRGYLVATGEAAFVESRLAIPVTGGSLGVVVRGWADDPAWRKRTTDVAEKAATAIAAETGLAGPAAGLVIEEATTWALGGGAVVWDPSIGRLLVAHDAPRAAVVRGIAQTFLGSDIVAERWAIEGLSEVYAERVAAATGVVVKAPAWSDAIARQAGSLNAWPGPSAEPTAMDRAAQSTAAELGRRILDRVGPDGARAALARLAAGLSVYQPATGSSQPMTPETADGLPDWRRILDAFEAEMGPGTSLDDLWSKFVVRPDEATLLPQRIAARTRFRVTESAAAGWTLPAAIREALSNWRFDTAQALLDEVDLAVVARSELDAAAAALGLDLPEHVQPLFERGRLDAALAEADAESKALTAIASATAAASPIGPLASVGLLGETPAEDLAAARSAFEAGRIDDAIGLAFTAETAWRDAEGHGRSRLTLLGLLFGTIGVALLTLRLRRSRTPAATRPRPDRASPR